MRRHLAKYIWLYAVVVSLTVHFFVYVLPYINSILSDPPEKVRVPVNVRVVDKSVPVRKGDIEGSFVPPKEEPKAKPAPAKKKPSKKSTAQKAQPTPKPEEEVEAANTLPGQKEIVGASEQAFGSPDGTLDGVVAIQGEADLSQDAELISSSVIIPEYTDGALDAGFEGLVRVEVFVDKRGVVQEAEISRKVGYGMDQRIKESAMNARFTPRRNAKGEALDTWTEIPFRFVIP